MANLKQLFFCIIVVVSIGYGRSQDVLSGIAVRKLCYRYDSSVTPKLQNVTRQAMDAWENATCVEFDQSIDEDCVVIYNHPNEECCTSSLVGREQKVTLGYSCQTYGDLLYTLSLIMGLHTEQVISETEEYLCSGDVTDYGAPGNPNYLHPGDVLKANRLYNCPGVGVCEVLNVDIGSVLDLPTEYAGNCGVEVVGVDGEGRTQNLSSAIVVSGSPANTSLTWNETLEFQVNTAKWQFFRIAVKQLSEDDLLMVETVAIEVGRSAVRRHMATEFGAAELSFSYECTADRNDCDPDPCVSATRCNDELFRYTCDCQEGFGGKICNIQCPNGYSGYHCTIDISGDSCLSSPCTDGHSNGCTDGFFDYTCSCHTGYGGKNCETTCPRGYSGRDCDQDISGDSCSPNPCHRYHSSDCVDHVYDYNCTCFVGFGGKNCERPCPHGYGGFNCDIDLSGDSCGSNPCNAANSLSCVDGFFDYTCNCRTGYGGKQCATVCPRGYDGYHCDIDISGNSCSPNPCHSRNTRRCIDGFFDYTCVCNAGFGGNTCATDLCASGRCNRNGGRCIRTSYLPNYRCECPLAWTPASQCTVWESRCLQVVIKRAHGLDDKDGWFKGDSDPYTKITAYATDGHSASGKTRYIQGDESPTWNHRFNAGCGHPWNRFFFQIYDSDVGSDDRLSSGQTVYLSSLGRFPRCNYAVRVQGGGGTIYFDVYYYNSYGPGQPGSC